MNSVLQETAHRPWSLPPGPWVMAQSWHDLLFAHWSVHAVGLRSLIPSQLQIDTFEGKAWIGVVPFRMTGVRLRGAPAVPGVCQEVEHGPVVPHVEPAPVRRRVRHVAMNRPAGGARARVR